MVTGLSALTWRDWLPPALLLAVGLGELWIPGFTNGMYVGPAWGFTVQIALYCAALTLRRRRPLTVALGVAILVLVVDLWAWQALLFTQVGAIALASFACGRYGVRPWAFLGAPLSTMIIGVDALLRPGPQFSESWMTAPPTLSDVPALVGRMRSAGLPVTLESDPGEADLHEEDSATAYRVIQESLTNVLRHAGKVPTHVRVRRQATGLEIDIRDDGQVEQTGPVSIGDGLLGMKERVAARGGTFSCGPSPGGGFHVQALLPTQLAP